MSGNPRASADRARFGAQFDVALPSGRTQESEADIIGIDLMARAGFDPRQSIQLWECMYEAGGPPTAGVSLHSSFTLDA